MYLIDLYSLTSFTLWSSEIFTYIVATNGTKYFDQLYQQRNFVNFVTFDGIVFALSCQFFIAVVG